MIAKACELKKISVIHYTIIHFLKIFSLRIIQCTSGTGV